MPAQLIQETDALEVSALCVLIYGPPGVWKTSLAQTAEKPLTLDFDKGIHRAGNRKAALRFGSWGEVNEAATKTIIGDHKTIIVDTVGRMLDVIALDVMDRDPKAKTRSGDLSITGWGALKGTFARWMGQLRLAGKDVVMIAHEKEEKDGDLRVFRPDIQGGSYGEVMKFTDLVGYMNITRGQRFLNFNPTDSTTGKNSAGFPPFEVHNLGESPKYLAGLLADAKASIGRTAVNSAALAGEVQPWLDWMESYPPLADFNAKLPGLKDLTPKAKGQVWNAVKAHAAGCKWVTDPTDKTKFAESQVEA